MFAGSVDTSDNGGEIRLFVEDIYYCKGEQRGHHACARTRIFQSNSAALSTLYTVQFPMKV